MEQQEYDELLRRLDARQAEHTARMARMDVRIELLETFQEQQQRLLEKMDARQDDLHRLLHKMDTRQDDLHARQQVHEEIMKSLAATLVKQDTINERLTGAIERLDGTLQAIKDMLPRGNGRTEG
jgi:hypothetical protein